MLTAAHHPYDVMKLYLWIAGLGFATGFLGYVSLHGMPL